MSTQTVMPIIHRYSELAKRVRKWERWEEPPLGGVYGVFTRRVDEARYFGLRVRVVQAMSQLALIEWGGHGMVVETADLEVRP